MAAMIGDFVSRARMVCLLGLGGLLFADQTSAAEAYRLAEPPSDARVKSVKMQVAIGGTLVTSAGAGKELSHPLNASADYRFRERRLTGAGRDAEAFRCLREFEHASVRTEISKRLTTQTLPRRLSVIAVQGQRYGMLRYSPDELLTRDYLELIDVPGDPLTIVALLPTREVEVDEEWEVPDWAVQMLTTLEAASTAKMTAKLTDVSDGTARVEFDGLAEGTRLGAVTNVKLSGHLLYDLKRNLIRSVDLSHDEKGTIGPITLGIDSHVHVTIKRSLADSPGALTDKFAASIPLEPPADRLPLRFDASPWGLQLVHSRGWHVYHANFDSKPEVVILRLLDGGGPICQCNFSPVPDAAPGEHTPLDEYEDSIRQSLGQQFGAIVARDSIPTSDGHKIFRVTVQGESESPDGEETKAYPMSWIYYLCAAPSGRQVSFVFAVEPAMRERLAGQDRQMVESLLFTKPSR